MINFEPYSWNPRGETTPTKPPAYAREEKCHESQAAEGGDSLVDVAIKERVAEFVTQLLPDETPKGSSSLLDWRQLSAKVVPTDKDVAALKPVSVDRLKQVSAMFCVESPMSAAIRRSKEGRKKIAYGQCLASGAATSDIKQSVRSSKDSYYVGAAKLKDTLCDAHQAQIADLFCVESPAEAAVRRSTCGQKSGSVGGCQGEGQSHTEEDNSAKNANKNAVLRFCQSLKRVVTGK